MLSTYFSCVMIRLMLIIAPAACVLAAIGVSEVMRKMSTGIRFYLVTLFEKENEDEKDK